MLLPHHGKGMVFTALVAVLVVAALGAIGIAAALVKHEVSQGLEILGLNSLPMADEREEVDAPVTMFAVGDLMLGRNVESLMRKNGDEYPFAKLGDLLDGYDIVFGNLEGPVPERHVQTPAGGFSFNFRKEVPGLLKSEGFTVVSLANNHSFDFGRVGFDETRRNVAAAGLGHMGHYSQENYDFYTTEVRGKKILMVAFNMIEPDFDEAAAVAWAAEVAKQPHDVYLASIHWGAEYVQKPAAEQKRLAQKLLDTGVDVILGHHPHIAAQIGTYKEKTIFYSMGNFIFDQYWSEPTQFGFGVALSFTDDVVTMRLVPIDLHGSQPRTMEKPRAEAWLSEFAKIADPAIAEMVRGGVIVQPLAPRITQ